MPKFQSREEKKKTKQKKQISEYNNVNDQPFIFIVLTVSTTSLKNYQGTLLSSK